jgi:hypothetical protein
MKVKDLIKELLDAPMESEVIVREGGPIDPEDGDFDIVGVDYEFPESHKPTVIGFD